ncbi:DUF2116 family Zn-ribbon domain-containing protein [Candidatus Bathyarchaeota archaeon]|nr:MAG: DUF2116 family Zn-ribbon domain-containing protein [Candidatus Bathyarchaeota archaeon]
MVEKHRHCVVCGISVSPDKEPPVCSKKCEFILKKRMRREKIMWSILPLPLLIMFIIFMLMGHL